MALPLGELSPKVTERALQALPISTGHCSNDTHLRLVIPRRGRKPDAAISGRQQRICRGLSRVPDGTARLPRLLRSLAMTNLGVPSSRVIARRAQARRGNLMQALLNGNRNERENGVSLSGGCAASSPKGRAKLCGSFPGGCAFIAAWRGRRPYPAGGSNRR